MACTSISILQAIIGTGLQLEHVLILCSAHTPEHVHTWTHAEIHLHVCTYESINKFVDVANCILNTICYASTFQVQSHMHTLVQP